MGSTFAVSMDIIISVGLEHRNVRRIDARSPQYKKVPALSNVNRGFAGKSRNPSIVTGFNVNLIFGVSTTPRGISGYCLIQNGDVKRHLVNFPPLPRC